MAVVITPDGQMTIDETKITRIISPHQGEPYTHVWGPAGRGAIPVKEPSASVLVASLRLQFPLVKFSTCAGPNVPVWVAGPLTSLVRSPTAFEKAGQHPPPNAIIIVGGLPQPILETVPTAIAALNAAGGHLIAAPPASANFDAEVIELFVAPGQSKPDFNSIWN